jgi:hypothetical protein
MKESAEIRENKKSRRTQIVAVLITATATITGAFIAAHKYLQPAPSQQGIRVSGRVADSRTDAPIRKAVVSLEAGGVPETTESDSMGIFSARLPADYSVLRIRVSASGFKPYDQLLPRDQANEMLHVNLDSEPHTAETHPKPPSERPGSGFTTPHQPVSQPPASSSLASLLNTSLPPSSGDGGPWAVIVFGDQERRDDVTSAIRSALSGAGHDTISLFRKVSDEQRLATELFRGSADVLKDLQPGRFSSRILVGKLTLVRLGNTEGIVFARATLGVHVLSPTGEILKQFDLSAKGGGEDESSARRRAIDELMDEMPRELPAKVE